MEPLIDRWWLMWRDDSVVRRAALRSLAENWPVLFWKALRDRRSAGTPVKKETIAQIIGCDRTMIYRQLGGELPVNLDLLYGFASLVGVEVKEILPRTVVEWISRVTMRIASGDISECEAHGYASYMWLNPLVRAPFGNPRADIPDPSVLRLTTAVLREMDSSWDEDRVQDAVIHVARCLRLKLAHRKTSGGAR